MSCQRPLEAGKHVPRQRILSPRQGFAWPDTPLENRQRGLGNATVGQKVRERAVLGVDRVGQGWHEVEVALWKTLDPLEIRWNFISEDFSPELACFPCEVPIRCEHFASHGCIV